MTWEKLAQHVVVIYSTSWCGDCRRLKAQLDCHGIPYREIDIEENTAAARFLRERTGCEAIPFVELAGRPHLIPGWHEDKPGRWDENTFLADADRVLRSA